MKPSLPVAAPELVDLGQRKERILHTRVPESLDRHIKHRARGLGMSVSTVVRNILLNTFGLVEDIVTDGTNIALALTGQETIQKRERAGASETDILAWQEAVLNRNAVCDHCNAVLRTGTRAAIAVREQPGPGPWAIICRRCLRRVENGSAKPSR